MKKTSSKIFKTNKFYKDKNGKFKTIYRHKCLGYYYGITDQVSYNIYRISKNPKSKIHYGKMYTKKDINKDKKSKKISRRSKRKKMKGGVTEAGEKLMEDMKKKGTVVASEGMLADFKSGNKSYISSVRTKICSNDPIFKGSITTFKNGDYIECARCKSHFHYEGEEISVVTCPSCDKYLTNINNDTMDLLRECDILPKPWDCLPAFWKQGTPHTIGQHPHWASLATATFRTGKYIPDKYKDNNYYFINRLTGETYWELPK